MSEGGGGGAGDAVCAEPTLLRGLCNYGTKMPLPPNFGPAKNPFKVFP